MTAVEWFVENSGLKDNLLWQEQIEKAIKMEKEQIQDAWNEGQSNGATICTPKYDNPSEEYYNETFKSK